MKKNKLYIPVIAVIMITIVCLAFSGCLKERQLDKVANEHPFVFNVLFNRWLTSTLAMLSKDDYNTAKGRWDDKYAEILLDILEKSEPVNNAPDVVGVNEDFKPLDSLNNKKQLISTEDSPAKCYLLNIQDEIKINFSAPEESDTSEESAAQTQETKKGSITLEGDMDGMPITLIINLDTGEVSGTASYYDNDAKFGVTTFEGEMTGNMDLVTKNITANGTGGGVTFGADYTSTWTMTGQLNEDSSGAEGIAWDADETWNWKAQVQSS